MKHTLLVTAQAVLGSVALLGCAALGPQPPDVKPVFDVRHAMAPAQAYYQLGRYLQGQGDWVRAEDAYRKAIALRDRYWEAHNGLGAVLALQGRFDASRESFEAALAIAPEVEYLHANLRHLQRLAGGEPEVAPVVEPALDTTARMSETHGVVVVAGSATVPPVQVVQAGGVIAEAAPGVYVIPDAAPAAAPVVPATAAAAIAAATQPPIGFRLEVSNGNGVTGMARYVGTLLAAEGLPRARLSNQRPFVEPQSRIEYRAGFASQARALSERLPGRPSLVAATALRPVTDVRVVLGHDLPRTLDFALDAPPMAVAAAEGLPDY